MNTTDLSNLNNDPVSVAIARRLARLRSMPVDTSRLAARLGNELPDLRDALERTGTGSRHFFLFRPLRVAAAGFIILGLILVAVLGSSGGPALASAERLAAVHEDMVAGRSPMMMRVSSVEAAGAALSQQWPNAPALPDMPNEHVMACCVHEFGRKRVACVLLKIDGKPVTMAVANRADIGLPQGKTVIHGGVAYRVHSSRGINMAMAERGARWICLIGSVPVGQLVESIAQLQF